MTFRGDKGVHARAGVRAENKAFPRRLDMSPAQHEFFNAVDEIYARKSRPGKVINVLKRMARAGIFPTEKQCFYLNKVRSELGLRAYTGPISTKSHYFKVKQIKQSKQQKDVDSFDALSRPKKPPGTKR